MKLGLDIHGVLDVRVEFFSKLTKVLINAGWEIHIITGSGTEQAKREMTELGMSYTHIFSVCDHLVKTGAKTNAELGIASRYPFPDETWNKVKSIYCIENKIDMHIDDMPEYLEHFSTPFMTHIDKNRNHRGQFGKHKRA